MPAPSGPEATTQDATGITTTSATLNGTVNPNGQTSEAWFEWGQDPALASFTATAHQTGLTGSTPIAVSQGITGLGIGATYYFRVAAKVTGDAAELKGTIKSFSTSNPPPIADAGADQAETMGRTVTLDGSGSSAPVGSISYQWQQVSGTAVILSDDTAASPAFTAPSVSPPSEDLVFRLTVTDSITLLTASDNVTVAVLWGFFDDFGTNTLSSYDNQAVTIPPGGTPDPFPQFNYDAAGRRLEVITADNVGLIFSKGLPATDNGVFSLDFYPLQTYPTGGGLWVRLKQDANNYYEVSGFDWQAGNPGGETNRPKIIKVVGGVVVDNTGFTEIDKNYVSADPPTTYPIRITFTSGSTTAEAFGETIGISTDTTVINVSTFEIQANQQDAFFDNILLR